MDYPHHREFPNPVVLAKAAKEPTPPGGGVLSSIPSLGGASGTGARGNRLS